MTTDPSGNATFTNSVTTLPAPGEVVTLCLLALSLSAVVLAKLP